MALLCRGRGAAVRRVQADDLVDAGAALGPGLDLRARLEVEVARDQHARHLRRGCPCGDVLSSS